MEDNFFLSSMSNVPNYNIKESKGIIYSQPNYSFGQISQALNDLKKQAINKGCNSIINIHLFSQVSNFIAYGEAVIIQKFDGDFVKEAAPSLTEKPK